MKPILVIGSLNADLVVRVPHFPLAGETLSGDDLQVIAGGKGANQAVAAARMGATVHMLGAVGQDAFGPMLMNNLQASGVDVSQVKIKESATGTAVITVNAAGENQIVLSAGANALVSAAEIDFINFADYGLLLLQLEIPLSVVAYAAQKACAAGCKVILNPAPAQALSTELLKNIEIIIPNETELKQLTSCQSDDVSGMADCARSLIKQGVRTVLLTLGANGSLLINSDEEKHIPAYTINPVDTTAAGDAFIGGVAAWLAQGHSVEEAMRVGNACGALAASKFGAQPSLPTLAEVQKFLQLRND